MYQAGTVGQISHCLPVELVGDTELSRVLPAQLAALGACLAARAGLEALLTGAPGASAVCRTPNKIKLSGRAGPGETVPPLPCPDCRQGDTDTTIPSSSGHY